MLMAPKAKGKTESDAMVRRIEALATKLGLQVEKNVKHGTTVWASVRKIKIVLSNGEHKKLGIDCFCQWGSGTAYLKYFAKELDVKEYQFKGIVAWEGSGFPQPFVGVLKSRGAIHMEDIESYIKTHFGIPKTASLTLKRPKIQLSRK